MLLAEVIDEFGEATRRRGQEYFRAGSVKLLAHSPTVIRAAVKGGQEYAVKFQIVDGRLLLLSCTCPFFDDAGPCKHLWATALTAEDRGVLAALPSPGRIEYEEANLSADDDDDDDEDELHGTPASLIRLLGSAMGLSPLRGRSSGRDAPRAPEWKRLLQQAVTQTGGAEAPVRRVEREILYAVDVQRTHGGQLVVVVLERHKRKDGGWGKEKPARITRREIPFLVEENDRRILPMLQGLGTPGPQWSSYGWSGSYGDPAFAAEVSLSATAADVLMPMLAETGRLRVRADRDQEPTPAAFDSAAPWEFTLVVERDEGGATTDVVGALRRGDESIDLDEPLVVTRSGWMVRQGSIARFEHFGAFGLIVALREHHRIKVPRLQEQDFLTALLASPAVPKLALPEALALHEVESVPQPVLRANAANHGSPRSIPGRLRAQLLFDYRGEPVGAGDVRTVIARVRERQLVRRDQTVERAAADRLATLGLRRMQPGEYDIASKKFPDAVRALVSEGWRIEADGKLYRRPGKFDLAVASGIDWFDLTATVDFDGVTAQLPELLAALKRGDGTVVLDDGSLGIVPEEWLVRYGLLGDLGRVDGERIRFGRSQAGLLDALLAAEPEARVDQFFARVREELRSFDRVKPEGASRGFRGELRQYQEQGLGWLSFLRRFGFGGCLADDMGLGKTVQVLAMLEARRKVAKRPSLVVMPKSLVWNWRQEAARFAPKLRVLAHVGAERASDGSAFDQHDLVLTTYGTMRNDIGFLREMTFDHVILDEANAIKNAASESAKAARLLRGEHRLALTGTPIENHVGELWSLFEFLNPGVLGTARAFEGASGIPRSAPETAGLLARALRPFILRRTKQQVAPELPPKHEETILCELEPAQRRLYGELRDHYRTSLLGRIERDGLAKSKIQVLEALLRLRQAACHPGLIDKRRAREASGKLDVLLPRLLEVRDEGHKALVFSQFTSFLAIVRAKLDAEKIAYAYLDGKTEDRQSVVARFQERSDCPFFLVSLKAGGVGLNLTAADYVFILDPWWNPAVEAQAVDRTHRIGQAKQVFVYRLLCRDTVEEKVAALQESKRSLAEAIINADNSVIRGLDRETVEILLS